MIVCGIGIKSSEIHLVTLEGNKNKYEHLTNSTRKISLKDEKNQQEVQAFRDTVYAYFRENHIENIAIKSRMKKGEYSGGSVGFKLESIIQLYGECPVTLITPQSIAAAEKKYSLKNPSSILKYQIDAFKTAFTILS